MMDELPMVFGMCIQLFCILTIFPSSKRRNHVIIATLSLFATTFTLLYLYSKNPLFHEACFGLLVALTAVVLPYQIRSLSKSEPDTNAWRLYMISLLSFLGGWALWLFENTHCEALRGIRNRLGYPLRVVTEFHALYWHFGTVLSVYSSNLLVCYLRIKAAGKVAVNVQWNWHICGWLSKNENVKSKQC
ncbi:hypothetical protein BCR33DRAFT_330030 [Rhizoclosmatium globosum]|uniref:Uncharacterized protein n=1 Tax=Rhizoclosmatium globosum TaxID=329046 RepID=A0A1Y2C6U7_9FUNG|nr:hypothetical protein BCR33DRAFT_330030 [Rhizoclosmatium globosum]|eukprot:ORY42025.1 hypothetical protein BCR33DRAFT_330030 [Rhizoclosmatium globosum]